MDRDQAIILKNINKTFYLDQIGTDTLKGRLFGSLSRRNVKVVRALEGIDLEVPRGETLGIIGRNGSGKSTLVKIMNGSFIPDKGGTVQRKGTYMMMNLHVGISHELTARENIYVSGSTFGLRIREIDTIFDEIISFAELDGFVDTKIKYYSSGMIQRLCFSIAVNAKADIMFLDEVFTVGDQVFRNKATKVLEKNWLDGRTTVMVSHSLPVIGKYCQRVLYLKHGKPVYLGDPRTAIRMYQADNAEAEKATGN